ncbi:hypothetical protein BAUCODRAFT_79151 [Baudoinia panamericana UAMH 10762]|uniref:Glutamine amidotransferase domain-containing protein n=1 Tax=Baudoinia panamericana (strain UAMH 10762) TaxID=717646 RepID=M2LDA8_BAUPA|nr:uncharacterized protein BAUCODRAFT_79151 [Baudoinia panamericana UAMH 10762]EMC91942.1 hypothetical protein BAUCODRAFT_79151 [Baudoinia panamericana UAMH 10762]
MLKPTLRIAVLECDEPVGKTKEKYGGYGNLFAELLNNGADLMVKKDGVKRPHLDISKYNVVNEEIFPSFDAVDAVLMTGSKYNAFDNDPWILKLVEYTKKVLAQDRVRLIGVCFGHQIIGRAMGSKVDRSDQGWEISCTPVTLTEKGKELFGVPKLAINQMHHDIVYTHPSSVEPLGHSDRCEVQGMYSPRRLISTQGHPEFGAEVITELLQRRHEQGVFDDAMFEEALTRANDHHDGVAVAAAFVRFLLED